MGGARRDLGHPVPFLSTLSAAHDGGRAPWRWRAGGLGSGAMCPRCWDSSSIEHGQLVLLLGRPRGQNREGRRNAGRMVIRPPDSGTQLRGIPVNGRGSSPPSISILLRVSGEERISRSW